MIDPRRPELAILPRGTPALLLWSLTLVASTATGCTGQDAAAGRADRDSPRVIGLVELPGLFGTRDPEGPPGMTRPATIRTLPLFAGPDSASGQVGVVSAPDSLEWREFDYEAPAAVAYGEEGGWVRVAFGLPEDRAHGWVPPAHRGALHPLATLLTEGLTYLTASWDGTLRDGPSFGSDAARVGAGAPADVNVLRVVEADGATWLRVEVLEPGRCERAEPPAVVATGWLPAHTPDGRPTVWFYSRGC